MSNEGITNLSALSEGMVALVAKASEAVVAVKAAPYRTVSGLRVRGDLIAVCHHSLRREGTVPVWDADGEQKTGSILGRDRSLDLAFIRCGGLEASSLETCPASDIRTGMVAAVVGMTHDVGATASFGGVGAVGPARRMWRGGEIDQFIRLDVNLYPSQSGAAVVDAGGRLIGMATPALSRHSAMAIPNTTLQRIADELLKEGRIRQGYLGIGTQRVMILSSLAEKLELSTKTGLILLHVEPDSPAEKAGLLIGDILLAMGETVLADSDDLQSLLRGQAVGTTLQADVLRGGERINLPITIGERARKEN